MVIEVVNIISGVKLVEDEALFLCTLSREEIHLHLSYRQSSRSDLKLTSDNPHTALTKKKKKKEKRTPTDPQVSRPGSMRTKKNDQPEVPTKKDELLAFQGVSTMQSMHNYQRKVESLIYAAVHGGRRKVGVHYERQPIYSIKKKSNLLGEIERVEYEDTRFNGLGDNGIQSTFVIANQKHIQMVLISMNML